MPTPRNDGQHAPGLLAIIAVLAFHACAASAASLRVTQPNDNSTTISASLMDLPPELLVQNQHLEEMKQRAILVIEKQDQTIAKLQDQAHKLKTMLKTLEDDIAKRKKLVADTHDKVNKLESQKSRIATEYALSRVQPLLSNVQAKAQKLSSEQERWLGSQHALEEKARALQQQLQLIDSAMKGELPPNWTPIANTSKPADGKQQPPPPPPPQQQQQSQQAAAPTPPPPAHPPAQQRAPPAQQAAPDGGDAPPLPSAPQDQPGSKGTQQGSPEAGSAKDMPALGPPVMPG